MYLGSKQNNNLGFKINESRYLLRIKIDQIDPSINFPSGLFFNGVEFKDNGLGNDKVKGDGIYTSIKEILIEEEKPNFRKLEKWVTLQNKTNPNLSCIGCNSIDLAGPGEACLDEGTCPEFDWWSNYFCVCGSDCYFCIGDSCECEN